MFVKLTRMNTMGQEVGPVWVGIEALKLSVLDPTELQKFDKFSIVTNIHGEFNSMLFVKESPDEIINLMIKELMINGKS